MIRKISGLFLTAFLFSAYGPVLAAKTTYIHTDRKFHFIKRVELKEKELKKRGEAGHPHTFTELQLRNMLADLQVSQKMVLSKEVETQEIFNSANLDFIIPHLVEAFKQAQPNEEVVFSFITRRSKTIFQDNRITLAECWVKDGFLHLRFRKLLAKIDLTNYDKLGDVATAINKSRGLRIDIDLKPGQEFGETTEEVLLGIGTAVEPSPAAAEKELPAAELQRPEAGKEPAVDTGRAESKQQAGVEERLKKLKGLKDQGLIGKKDYEAKRKEILKDL